MNCAQVREELELSFGSEQLSDEVTRHFSECEACRAYYAELIQLAAGLGDDLDAGLSTAEIERAVRGVEARIAPLKTRSVTSLRWFQPVVRLAAAAMVVLVAYGAYEFGKSRTGMVTSDDVIATDTGYGSLTAFLQTEDVSDLDDNMVSVLINEYSASAHMGADEALLGDITVEELEYLTKNLKVGELL